MSSATMPPNSSSDALVYGDPHLHVNGEVLALAYDAEGMLWSVEDTGLLRKWDTKTGSSVVSHSLSDLETVWRFGVNAQFLASASDDVSIWETKSGRLMAALPQPAWVSALAFHPSQMILATGHEDGSVRLWDIKKARMLREFPGHTQQVSALAFSLDGTKLASAGEEKLILLWNTQTGKNIGSLEGHKDRIPDLLWHKSGDILVSAGWDTTARVWDTKTCDPIILLNSHATQVLTLAFSPDHDYLACSDSNRVIHIWTFADKKTVHLLKESEGLSRLLAYNADGSELASAGDGMIHLWNPQTGTPLLQPKQATGTSVAMSLSPDGKRLAVGGGAGLHVWDTQAREIVFPLEEPMHVNVLAFSPDNQRIAGGTDSYIRIWDASTGHPQGLCEGQKRPITAMTFSPDGKFIASGSSSGMRVWIWTADDGEPFLLIPDALQGCTVEGLAFHPNSKILAVAGIEPSLPLSWRQPLGDESATTNNSPEHDNFSTGAVSLWDIFERAEIATFPGGATCVTFDSAGKYLAAGHLDNTLCIWDVEQSQIHRELYGHEDTIRDLCFSPDGKWLVSVGDDRTIRFWDTTDWHMRVSFELETQIKTINYSPDGKFLFSGNGNSHCYRHSVAAILATAKK